LSCRYDSWVQIVGLDISPSKYSELTISIWVRLHSYANERGWIVHSDDASGGYDRAIILHDTRYGEDGNGVGLPALGAGKTCVCCLL
jgi:hypothetical protein